jgi:formiminoglutamase
MSDDPRLGDLFERGGGRLAAGGVGLVFFPNDEGVRRNGGRPGAAHGPRVFWKLLQRTGTLVNAELGIDLSEVAVATVGSQLPPVQPQSLEEEHELLRARVASVLAAGALPFVVGGGNDQSYPNARAALDHGLKLACVNIDAHLDVRPLKEGRAHSGSPFRQLLEDPRFAGRNFVEFASQGAQCSAQHAAYVAQSGGRVMWLGHLRQRGVAAAFEEALAGLDSDTSIFISFDLDAVAGEHAPGVSAPGVVGLSAAEALQLCFVAGANPRVALFDLSEFNPLAEPGLDADNPGYRTGKLVAAMFYNFLLGFNTRPSAK